MQGRALEYMVESGVRARQDSKTGTVREKVEVDVDVKDGELGSGNVEQTERSGI